MPQPGQITKAFLQEITWNDRGRVVSEGRKVTVQFNPETLKVTFTNQIAGDDNRGGSAIQFAGRGTTKLAFEMWFDVTAPQPGENTETDVRKLTKEVARFMKTTEEGSGEEVTYTPPGVRFQWGSFLFEGVMESMEETLEFFSETGIPLRAGVSVSLAKQDVKVRIAQANAGAANADSPGTRPQQQANEGETLHSAVARQGGNPEDTSRIAHENGIEDILRPAVGTPVNPNFHASIGARRII